VISLAPPSIQKATGGTRDPFLGYSSQDTKTDGMISMTQDLTERQKTEKEFFDRYFSQHATVSWDSLNMLKGERRPWNENWFALQCVLDKGVEGKSILDLGCGRGVRTHLFAKAGASRSVGCDISKAAIQIANTIRETAPEKDRIELYEMTAEQLSFGDGTFDIVFGENILHHAVVASAIRETRRVLKKGGYAVFCEWVKRPLFDKIRNMKIVKEIFPHGGFQKQSERYVTEHEKKLTQDDLKCIRDSFATIVVHKRYLFTRIPIYMHASTLQPFFEKADYTLLRTVPFLQRWAAAAIIECFT
jgi:ubiquinone/menaquinone biosynthesis C-methylase UbiE